MDECARTSGQSSGAHLIKRRVPVQPARPAPRQPTPPTHVHNPVSVPQIRRPSMREVMRGDTWQPTEIS
eukprot:142468-Rhodomonas_salina.1